jgi:hypothetical protein
MILGGRLVGLVLEGDWWGRERLVLRCMFWGESTYSPKMPGPRLGLLGRPNHSPRTGGDPFRARTGFDHGETKPLRISQGPGYIRGPIVDSADTEHRTCHLASVRVMLGDAHIKKSQTHISDGGDGT